MSRVPTRSLIVAAAVLGLVLVGPDWPARTTELVCGESVDEKSVREVLTDVDACTVAMGREADAGTHCFCSVRQTWMAPAYYLGLVPLAFISAVWFGIGRLRAEWRLSPSFSEPCCSFHGPEVLSDDGRVLAAAGVLWALSLSSRLSGGR